MQLSPGWPAYLILIVSSFHTVRLRDAYQCHTALPFALAITALPLPRTTTLFYTRHWPIIFPPFFLSFSLACKRMSIAEAAPPSHIQVHENQGHSLGDATRFEAGLGRPTLQPIPGGGAPMLAPVVS